MNELAKIDSFRREIAIAETIEEVKMLSTKGELLAEMAKKLNITTKGQNDLGRTRVQLEERKRELIEQMFPKGRCNQYTAKFQNGTLQNIGITRKESSNAKIIKEEKELVEEVMDEIEQSNEVITPKVVAAKVRKKKTEIQREQQAEEGAKKAKDFNDKSVQIFNIDFRDYKFNESVDLILTDPPYPEEFLPLWKDLFLLAKRNLKPNGFLIAYSGQMYLDKIFKYANEAALDYYWMMNIEFTKKPLIHGRNVLNEWKPILIFQNGIKKHDRVFSDKISMPYSDRDMHDLNWGQTVEPFEFLLDRFSNEMDLVFEPFAGTGTTLLACKNKKRRCIGTEIEEKYIELIKGRLS